MTARAKRVGPPASRNVRFAHFPTLKPVPKFWIWTQAAIVFFVLVGMVIALVKIA
jgi:hypothetical protein